MTNPLRQKTYEKAKHHFNIRFINVIEQLPDHWRYFQSRGRCRRIYGGCGNSSDHIYYRQNIRQVILNPF